MDFGIFFFFFLFRVLGWVWGCFFFSRHVQHLLHAHLMGLVVFFAATPPAALGWGTGGGATLWIHPSHGFSPVSCIGSTIPRDGIAEVW